MMRSGTRRFGGLNALLAVVLAGIACVLSSPRAAHAFDVLGYYFLPGSLGQMEQFADALTQVSFDNFKIDSQGNVKGKVVPQGALQFAKDRGIKAFLCVNNWGPTDFNGPRIHAVLNSDVKRNRLINQLVKKAQKKGFDGINIDFEAIPKKDRGKVTKFMQKLAARTRPLNLTLVMSVPAMSEDRPKDSWAGAFDYKALGEIVDILQIMTYDEHGSWSKPGPVASFPFVRDSINYAKSVVPPHKISMGVPGYGYQWNLKTKKVRSLHQQELDERLEGKPEPIWDEEAKSPRVEFTEKGKKFVIWYENKQSLEIKGQFARESGIAGVSVWALNGLNQAFWDGLL